MKIGYARVSSQSQSLASQIEELQREGCDQIYSESISAKDNERPELQRMMDSLRRNDTVVVSKIDRLARSLSGLISITEQFNKRGVNLKSLDRADNVDTTTPMGRAFLQIAGVFAELERSIIRARTDAGRERAMANGVKFGRKVGSVTEQTKQKIERVKIFLQAGKSYSWIGNELNVSHTVISKIKKELIRRQD